MSFTSPQKHTILDLALVFLKLGCFSFGGPAAHIAMMEEELVRKKRWITREKFLDLTAASHLIPGPNSTELALHLGAHRGGLPGLAAAGICFIVPSFLFVLILAWSYVKWGELAQFQNIFAGIKPVIAAVIFQALWSLGPAAIRTKRLALIGIFSALAYALGVHEMAVLLTAGFAAVVFAQISSFKKMGTLSIVPMITAPAAVSPGALLPSPELVFWVFFKIGALLFGSGYVLLAFLRSEMVERLGWLSEAQLLDAIAAGQITPGPVFTAATFVGYLLLGWKGALAATVGIFLPAFIFVGLSAPLVPKIRKSKTAGAFLDGVIAASLAMLAVVLIFLGGAFVSSPAGVSWALVSAVLLILLRVPSYILILAGAAAGYWIKF